MVKLDVLFLPAAIILQVLAGALQVVGREVHIKLVSAKGDARVINVANPIVVRTSGSRWSKTPARPLAVNVRKVAGLPQYHSAHATAFGGPADHWTRVFRNVCGDHDGKRSRLEHQVC